MTGREILDSRGLPTVECEITLDDDRSVVSSVPTGLSTGDFEAFQLRDNDKKRYFGLGVLKAVKNINKKIAPLVVGKKPSFSDADKEMIHLDGTDQKSNLGANAILAVSIAVAKAESLVQNIELYELISNKLGIKEPKLPIPMFNILNGGLHASNGLCFQEFMVMPSKQVSFKKSLEMGVKIYQHLKLLLFDAKHVVSVGDEGGFAPFFTGKNGLPDLEAFDYLIKAIKFAGFSEKDVKIGVDVASSQFFDDEEGVYSFHAHEVDPEELIEFYEKIISKYPISYIEDGISPMDFGAWKLLTKKLSKKVQIIGDDIFSTNEALIKEGIKNKIATGSIIKPNQVGTVSEALKSVDICRKNNFGIVVSHRSGETIDTFISDFAVGANSSHFKGGGCARGERIAKFNRLLRIEELLS